MSEQDTPAWAVELIRRVDAIDAKLTASMAEQKANFAAHEVWATRNIKDHETRLRDLEKARWQSAWISGLASAVVTAIVVAMVNYSMLGR